MKTAKGLLSCLVAAIMVIAFALPSAGILRTLSFADEIDTATGIPETPTVDPIVPSNNPIEDNEGNEEISDIEEDESESSDEEKTSNSDDDGISVASLDDEDSGIAAYSVTDSQLASHIVKSTDPDATTINLFNYSTGKTGSNGTDTVGTTGAAGPRVNYDTWLTGTNNINVGHLLTFGDGMRHLGYWNQGIVAAYGEVAMERPGMQNIVTNQLDSNGYPVINNNPEATGDEGVGGGYNTNPEVYSTAVRNTTEMIYANAGPLYTTNIANSVGNSNFDPVLGWNIDRAVQAQAGGGTFQIAWVPAAAAAAALTKADFTSVRYGVDWASGYELSEADRSLQYLFDPAQAAAGKQSYEDVTGLFQMDDQGYYYYNMRKNFAEYDSTTNKFVLYDAPAGLRTDGTNSVGNFFPFNSANTAFNLVDGKLESAINANNQGNAAGVNVDHHLGMTMETSFRQPVSGRVGNNDMTFEFVGDDDVWVFVDDVLVLDMGGIHSEVYGTINFSTGEVNIGTAYNSNGEIFNSNGEYITAPVLQSNLKQKFEEAGRADELQWNDNTFASSTSHTLKMFYLERGNYDSSIAVKFNLQPALYQQIKKVDQSGDPLANAEFDLYAVNVPAGTNVDNAADVTLDQVSIRGNALTHVVTDANGEARFTDPSSKDTANPEPFNFADRYDGGSEGLLYILRETKAPPGYKAVPTDLLLRFNPDNTMLVVNNRYQTGAYASFNSYVTGNNGAVLYGQIGEDGGLVTPLPENLWPSGATSAQVPVETQRNGLVVAVPMLKQQNEGTERAWYPLYGDNLAGFKTIKPATIASDYEGFKENTRIITLEGAMLQAAAAYRSSNGIDNEHAEGWYLTWDDSTSRLGGTLQNLPGRADRYLNTNPDGDMRMFYGIIEPSALASVLGVSEAQIDSMTSDQKYEALGRVVNAALDADGGQTGSHVRALIDIVNPHPSTVDNRGYSPLDISGFIRNFRTLLYIPNEQRQLRVTKIDQNGIARNGVEFTLYSTEADASAGTNPVASGLTATIDGTDGMLIFEPRQSHEANEPGYADVAWPNVSYESGAASYWLKETRAPSGCEPNPTIVPVKVGVYSIYADAGSSDDGVSVSAGVGKLAQTMVKYASDGDVNITLRDITSFEQVQPSGSFGLQDWEDVYLDGTGDERVPRSMNLHYGENAVVDYGLPDADGGKYIQPFFVTDTGYIRTRVQQNLHAHDDPNDPQHSNANADDLGDMDITSLFSLINTVIVTDYDENAYPAGQLSISKTVEGEGLEVSDYLHLYHFKFELFDESGNEVPSSERYYYFGRDRIGYIGSGEVLSLHHDEDLVILGIPEGYTYKVTETDANENGFNVVPDGGIIEGGVQKDALLQAHFVNTRKPDGPSGSEDGPGGDGTGDGGSDSVAGGLMPKLGDTLPVVLLVLLGGAAVCVAVSRNRLHCKGKHARR